MECGVVVRCRCSRRRCPRDDSVECVEGALACVLFELVMTHLSATHNWLWRKSRAHSHSRTVVKSLAETTFSKTRQNLYTARVAKFQKFGIEKVFGPEIPLAKLSFEVCRRHRFMIECAVGWFETLYSIYLCVVFESVTLDLIQHSTVCNMISFRLWNLMRLNFMRWMNKSTLSEFIWSRFKFDLS